MNQETNKGKTSDGRWKVLVTEPIHEAGLKLLLEAKDINLVQKFGMSRSEFLEELKTTDALLTRSGTAVDATVFDAAPSLKVVGRAGVGVDNVDLLEASKHGVVVINAPTGNTLSAAEHTMAMMLAMIRKIPQAFNSLLRGEWDRKRFMGHQLHGKKLLIIGLGRIGSQVAIRARAFGMEVMAYDPYIQQNRAESLGVSKLDDLIGALSLADITTLHVPLTNETMGMIGERQLKACKPGAFLVNCARGGLVDEKACADALRVGYLAGIAFDVFRGEPPAKDHPLLAEDLRDRIVLTPHLGANTFEAQSAVSKIAAENILAALRNEPYEHAVNLPFMITRLSGRKLRFLSLARKMGILSAHLSHPFFGAAQTCHVVLRGPLFEEEEEPIQFENPYRFKPNTIAFLKGFLEVRHGPEVSYMVAPILAGEKGLTVDEGRGESTTYKNLIDITIEGDKGTLTLLGTVTEEGRQRIVCVNGYWIDFVPEGRLLLFQNHDRPGVIGKIGHLLGENGINIANFALGRKNGSGLALGVLQIDQEISDEVAKALQRDVDFIWAVPVSFQEDL